MTDTALLNTTRIDGRDYALYPVERTVESVRTLADLGCLVLAQQVFAGTSTPYTMRKPAPYHQEWRPGLRTQETIPVAPHLGIIRELGETAAYFQIDKEGGVPALIAFDTVKPVDAPELEYELSRAELIG
jgi:hypothetical protein